MLVLVGVNGHRDISRVRVVWDMLTQNVISANALMRMLVDSWKKIIKDAIGVLNYG